MKESLVSHQVFTSNPYNHEHTLVSVVIPTFNRSAALSRAISSVQNQTFKNLEILVVDDGSTDDTARCIHRLKESDPRIRYFRQGKNKGAQSARNIGIKNAKGKWISFLDSDDTWLTDSLEKRLKAAEIQKVEVVHSGCYVKKLNDELTIFDIPKISGPSYKELLSRQGPMYQALLVSKKALVKIDYLDERIVAYQEWDTSIRLSKHYSFGFIDEPTFIYDCLGQDTISKNLLRNIVGYKQVLYKNIWAILLLTGPWTLAKHYRNIASIYRESGQRNAFLLHAAASFALWPFCPRLIINQIHKSLFPSRTRF